MSDERRHQKPLARVVLNQFTAKQRALVKKHGTPAEFALAVYACVGEISMGEAADAVGKYSREFAEAGRGK
jgi:hypothetical protein